VVPKFPVGTEGTDFNDLAINLSLNIAKKQLIGKNTTWNYPLTDGGNAERFVDQYQDDLVYCSDTGTWRVYDNGVFRKIVDKFLLRKAIPVVRKINAEINEIHSKNEAVEIQRWARYSDHLPRLKAMVELSTGFLAVDQKKFDADPMLLNVKNGVINLRTGQFLKHDRKYFMTKQCSVTYDKTATAPTWIRHLKTIFKGDQKLINFFQKVVGYTLTGMTTEEALIFAYGDGANGKTTTNELPRGRDLGVSLKESQLVFV